MGPTASRKRRAIVPDTRAAPDPSLTKSSISATRESCRRGWVCADDVTLAGAVLCTAFFDKVQHGVGQSLIVREKNVRHVVAHDVRHVVALGDDVDAREYTARVARCHLHAHRWHAGHEADLLAQDSGRLTPLRLVSLVLRNHIDERWPRRSSLCRLEMAARLLHPAPQTPT